MAMMYIRVDANSEIGMGHMMRCISIAEALKEEGAEVKFLVAGNDAVDILTQRGMEYIVLNTDFRDMESEEAVLKTILDKNEKILIDSYQVTDKYLKFLKQFGQVFYMDDVHSFEYPVDCVINGNIYGGKMIYSAPSSLTGCKYAPLRKEFRHTKRTEDASRILITTGGSDPFFITEKIVENILADDVLKSQQYDIVCGKFSKSYDKLCLIAKEHTNFRIHKDVKEMWKLMENALLAVTAGGTTMTELSCVGVPIVGFSFVDNQKLVTQTFFEEGYAHYGADYETLGDSMFPGICKAMKELIEDEHLRKEYSEKLMLLVDGKGCQRIASCLMHM